MSNAIHIYRLYDVAEEIFLDEVEFILAQSRPTSRLRLSRIKPKSIHIPNPPVTVELDEEQLDILGVSCRTVYSAKIYDLGVIGITMRIFLPREPTYQQLLDLSCYLQYTDDLEPFFRNRLSEIRSTLAPALFKPHAKDFVEDYLIFCLERWPEGWDAAPILLGEKEPLSEQTRRETTAHSFSYGRNDLTFITYDAAIVCDSASSQDIPELLEFAATQLLELRYYDELLREEIAKMYRDIEEGETVARFRRLRYYRRIMNRLMELVLDVSDITDRVENSLKITEDVYYARIYAAALNTFRTRIWAESIREKLNVIQQNYAMLSDEIVTQQSLLLESAIVVLILLEFLLGLPALVK